MIQNFTLGLTSGGIFALIYDLYHCFLRVCIMKNL